MADNNEIHTNGIVDGDGNDSDDDGGNTAFENPVIKIFRGFPQVSDETISKIRFDFCLCFQYCICKIIQ